MACSLLADKEKVLRELNLTLESLPDSFAAKISVPSVGFDFGSHHLRLAVVTKNSGDEKISLTLATFTMDDVDAALQVAKRLTEHEEQGHVSVFYTGRTTDQTVSTMNAAFEKPKEVTRRDKLDSHNSGVSFLLNSSIPEESLLYDMSHFDNNNEKSGFNPEIMASFFPPKMVQTMQIFLQEVMQSLQKKFPVILSIVGANNIICQVDHTGTYKTIDAHSVGGNSLNTMWKLIRQPSVTDGFEHFLELASKGERRNIDNVTNEILDFVGFYAMMPRNFPVFTFGKMERLKREDVKAEDLARATAALTTDILLAKVMDTAKLLHTYHTYFTGSLIQHEFVRNELMERSLLSGPMALVKPKFFKTDATAALGACIHSL